MYVYIYIYILYVERERKRDLPRASPRAGRRRRLPARHRPRRPAHTGVCERTYSSGGEDPWEDTLLEHPPWKSVSLNPPLSPPRLTPISLCPYVPLSLSTRPPLSPSPSPSLPISPSPHLPLRGRANARDPRGLSPGIYNLHCSHHESYPVRITILLFFSQYFFAPDSHRNHCLRMVSQFASQPGLSRGPQGDAMGVADGARPTSKLG